jgi:membrane protein DedA with SNARE-associated domain
MNTELLFHVASMVVGALAAYFGAQSALKERLAKVESIANHAHESVKDAHERIDRVLMR